MMNRLEAARMDAALKELSERHAKLREAVAKWRAVAQPIGPHHAYWDLIFDAEALLDGRKTILTPEQILKAANA